MSMDTITTRVIDILTSRYDTEATISLLGSEDINYRTPLYHHYIRFTDVHYGHLHQLSTMDSATWMNLLHRAMVYGCDITVNLGVPLCGLFPAHLLYRWPLIFRDLAGSRLYGFPHRTVVAGMVRTCESHAIIILRRQQHITAEALDVLASKGIRTMITDTE